MSASGERSARQSLITTTSRLMEEQGYHGTGLNQIIKESGAPRGSLYYYFPAGKEELAAAAIAEQGRWMTGFTTERLAAEADPVVAIGGLLREMAAHIGASHFCAGAPLAAVTLETAGASERLRAACQGAYAAQRRVFAAALERGGYPAARAMVLSRAEQSAAPLERVADEIQALLRAARPG
jgi:TetR/AcrR family transcriptional regulator, lmrAB and yxaGH operons repressor